MSVVDFLSRFTDWVDYKHKVLGSIDGKLVPIPFNLTSIFSLFDTDEATEIANVLIAEYGFETKITIDELIKSDNQKIKKLAQFVYDKVYLNYTLKQWGMTPDMLPKGVSARVPVSVSFDSGYFTDSFQKMPKDGYTAMFEKMLDHKNINVSLNSTKKILFKNGNIAIDNIAIDKNDIVIFTGCIDELFDYEFGALPYRSLEFSLQKFDTPSYQSNSVINYPNQHKYTRISEYSKFTSPITSKTIIAKEYPLPHKKGLTPYYPIENQDNLSLYNRYLTKAKQHQNLFFLGRLANYKYINMDLATKNALSLLQQIITQ